MAKKRSGESAGAEPTAGTGAGTFPAREPEVISGNYLETGGDYPTPSGVEENLPTGPAQTTAGSPDAGYPFEPKPAVDAETQLETVSGSEEEREKSLEEGILLEPGTTSRRDIEPEIKAPSVEAPGGAVQGETPAAEEPPGATQIPAGSTQESARRKDEDSSAERAS